MRNQFVWHCINLLLSDDDSFVENESDWNNIINRVPQIFFLIEIGLTCLFTFRQSTTTLLEEAKAGNFQAFINLLEVDKYAINIPEIRQLWEKEARNPKSFRFKSVAKAIAKLPVYNVNISRFKIMLAAGIEGIFKHANHPISRSQIRNLFDFYAQDTKKQEIDDDLPDSDEAFSLAVNRELKKFQEASKTTKQLPSS